MEIERMKKYMKKRNSLLVMLLIVSMFSLTACGSKETVETVNETEAVAVEETVAKEVDIEELKTVVVDEAAIETIVEETVEPTTEERPVYEGIDLESTLPLDEWIQTFEGIITEPKIIILNDETGRRQIVEDGDRVYFNPDLDYILVYLPGDAKPTSYVEGIHPSNVFLKFGYELWYLDPDITRESKRQAAAIYVNFNGEEVKIPFDFMPE